MGAGPVSFTHIPPLPGGEGTAGPIIALIAVAAGFMAVGLLALRRREIAVG
jgi:ABC-2 type transport system permease protein